MCDGGGLSKGFLDPKAGSVYDASGYAYHEDDIDGAMGAYASLLRYILGFFFFFWTIPGSGALLSCYLFHSFLLTYSIIVLHTRYPNHTIQI